MTIPPEIYGPFGAVVVLVLALIVAGRAFSALWRVHVESDADDRALRDAAIAISRDLVGALGKLTEEIASDRRDRLREQKVIEDALRRLEKP